MEKVSAVCDEVSIVMTQQRGPYTANTKLTVGVGMAHDMIKAGCAIIHPDSKKDWEYWNALYAKADAKDEAAAATRGAMNAKEQAEAKKVVEDKRTMDRLKTGHGDPIQGKRVEVKKPDRKPVVIQSNPVALK